MKKILSIALATAITATGVAGMAVGAFAEPAPAAAEAAVYLCPGSWYDAAEKEQKYNTVSGATALTEQQKTALHLETEQTYYKAGAAGTALPTPTTEKKDATGAALAFRGWWYIVDATVTYTETVPEVETTTYLYADFRAALSMPSDPSTPPPAASVQEQNYMKIIHKDGTEETLPLLVSGTSEWYAGTMGYPTPVQFSNEYFVLEPGDRLQVFLTCIAGEDKDEEPVSYPKPYRSNPDAAPIYHIKWEAGANSNTSMWLYQDDVTTDRVGLLTFGFRPREAQSFRIYFKVCDATSVSSPGTLSVYIEPKA